MYCQNGFFFVGDNIRPVIESADDVIMFRCIVGLFWWRLYKNNILNLACNVQKVISFRTILK